MLEREKKKSLASKGELKGLQNSITAWTNVLEKKENTDESSLDEQSEDDDDDEESSE